MHKSKVIGILQRFTKREVKKFGEYVTSPFFGAKEETIALYEVLRLEYPIFDLKRIEKEIIFSKVFPNESFEQQKLRYAMSDLTKLMEDFLAYKEYELASKKWNHYLLRAYSKKGLEKYHQQTFNIIKKNIEKSDCRNIDYYLNLYLLEEENFVFHSEKPSEIVVHLQEILKNLNHFYLSSKLKYASEIYNNKDVVSMEIEEPLFLEEILAYLQKEPPPSKTIAVYHTILMTLVEQDNETHFSNLLHFLATCKNIFTSEEMRDMYLFANNYCIKKINAGKLEYCEQLFNLYHIALNESYVMDKGFISEWDYKNIVRLSLRLQKFEFAEQFIYEYKKYLHPEKKTNAFNYSLAYFYFLKKDFSQTLSLLRAVEFTHPYYHLDTKIMILKCYYELQEMVPLFNLIDTVKTYVRRNKQISKANKSIYLSLFSSMKKLMNVKMGHKKTTDDLKKEIEKTQKGGDLAWLYEKIADLEKEQKRRRRF